MAWPKVVFKAIRPEFPEFLVVDYEQVRAGGVSDDIF